MLYGGGTTGPIFNEESSAQLSINDNELAMRHVDLSGLVYNTALQPSYSKHVIRQPRRILNNDFIWYV
jgi:hypothetical protein